jgi:hypothetical protein
MGQQDPADEQLDAPLNLPVAHQDPGAQQLDAGLQVEHQDVADPENSGLQVVQGMLKIGSWMLGLKWCITILTYCAGCRVWAGHSPRWNVATMA